MGLILIVAGWRDDILGFGPDTFGKKVNSFLTDHWSMSYSTWDVLITYVWNVDRCNGSLMPQ